MEWLGMEDPDWQKMILTLLASVIAIVLIISALIMMRYRPPPVDEAARLYLKFTKAAGVQPENGETPLRLAARIGSGNATIAGPADEITALYLDTRYGPPAMRRLDELAQNVRAFERR